MTVYLADLAWVDGAVRERVSLDIDAAGRLAAVTPGADRGQRIAGLVLPGIANLHSHAFQRAMAGLAEHGGPEGDDFRGWRDVMYRFLAALTPEDVQAVAAQLYVECLLNGYTSVAEFHDLHNAPDGTPYADPAEMALRIVAAARQSGIGLTLLPVLLLPRRLRRHAARPRPAPLHHGHRGLWAPLRGNWPTTRRSGWRRTRCAPSRPTSCRRPW